MSSKDTAKERILENAKQVFADIGYDKMSIRGLARHANVSHGLIRHHFGSKEQVWYAVVDHVVNYMSNEKHRLYQKVTTDFQVNESAFLMMSELIDNFNRDPLLIKLVVQFSHSEQEHFDYFVKGYMSLQEELRFFIEQSCEKGYIKNITAEEIMVMLIGMISVPSALPKIFAAHFDTSEDVDKKREKYLNSVKLVLASLLNVDSKTLLEKYQALTIN